ncbi:SIMPL domain-containing protein [Pseudohoeflea suaedae]|uniref:SIMPL domain-containing protein n=2 Tax=Pseudohoeflea suaedae TaxID=877384 RepID=A0A4R5PHU4_9HYPH|nr:SIMPL domain-containing protein [Pseudohoeflea suaedae]
MLALALSTASLVPLGTPAFVSSALAQEEAAKASVITVFAEGTASVVPDMAVINLTVLREADTAREALDANTAAMNEVLAALKEDGIEDRDIQTSNFSIQPRWVYPKKDDGNQTPTISGYQVTNGLTVRIRNLERVGDILDTSITLGVNQGGQIDFTNDKPDETIGQARKNAVMNARKKAEEMAEAAGVTLGRITSMSEQSYAQPIRMARSSMLKMAADESAPVPVAAGENEYSVSVSMSFEIVQ